jgi:hypothetical protein
MSNDGIYADFGVLDQLGADQGAHAGAVEGYREMLRQHVMGALGTLAGGVGTDEHAACMRKVDQLVDSHIAGTASFQRTTGEVDERHRLGLDLATRQLTDG